MFAATHRSHSQPRCHSGLGHFTSPAMIDRQPLPAWENGYSVVSVDVYQPATEPQPPTQPRALHLKNEAPKAKHGNRTHSAMKTPPIMVVSPASSSFRDQSRKCGNCMFFMGFIGTQIRNAGRLFPISGKWNVYCWHATAPAPSRRCCRLKDSAASWTHDPATRRLPRPFLVSDSSLRRPGLVFRPPAWQSHSRPPRHPRVCAAWTPLCVSRCSRQHDAGHAHRPRRVAAL